VRGREGLKWDEAQAIKSFIREKQTEIGMFLRFLRTADLLHFSTPSPTPPLQLPDPNPHPAWDGTQGISHGRLVLCH
jgi:hypothetical protein